MPQVSSIKIAGVEGVFVRSSPVIPNPKQFECVSMLNFGVYVLRAMA